MRLKKLHERNLLEIEVTDKRMQELIKEFADSSDEIDKLKAQLGKLTTRYKQIEDELTPVLEELNETGERALEIKGIIVTLKKMGSERATVSYKDGFELLLTKVNPAIKKIAEAALEATKKISKVKSSIGVQRVSEASILDKIKSFFNKIVSLMSKNNKDIDKEIRNFKRKAKLKESNLIDMKKFNIKEWQEKFLKESESLTEDEYEKWDNHFRKVYGKVYQGLNKLADYVIREHGKVPEDFEPDASFDSVESLKFEEAINKLYFAITRNDPDFKGEDGVKLPHSY